MQFTELSLLESHFQDQNQVQVIPAFALNVQVNKLTYMPLQILGNSLSI